MARKGRVQVGLRVRGHPAVARALGKAAPTNNSVREQVLDRVLTKAMGLALTKYILPGPGGPVRATRLTNRTGRLRQSIYIDTSQYPREGNLAAGESYADLHELGLGRFRARPYLKPALFEAAKDTPELVVNRWARTVD